MAILVATPSLCAAQVTLAWDPNSEPDVAGYRLYYGSPGGEFGTVINTGNVTNFTAGDLVPGSTYAFYVTCYNTSGLESEPSNVVEYLVPPIGDGGPEVSSLRVTASGLEINWEAIPGAVYRILFKGELSEPEWQLLDEFEVGGESGYFVDVASRTAPRRFYKLEVVE